jgi:hypothetical protein
MTKLHPKAGEKGPEKNIPLWEVIEKEGAAGLQNPNTLRHPSMAPIQIGFLGERIVRSIAVFLSEVEWRIGKDRIDNAIPDPRKDRHAVVGVQGSETG